MKATKVRNHMIYRATNQSRSAQAGSMLSKDLRKKYGKRSVRVVEGDSVAIIRGEFSGVDGKVSKVSTQKGSVAIEGIKKEQTRGEKYDVYIHASNLLVKSLNTDDKWRMARLEGKDPRKQPKAPKAGPKEAAGDAPGGAAAKAAKGAAKDAPDNAARDEPEGTKDGAAEDTLGGAAKDEPGDIPENAAKDAPEAEPKDDPKDAPGGEPKDAQPDAKADAPKETKAEGGPKEGDEK